MDELLFSSAFRLLFSYAYQRKFQAAFGVIPRTQHDRTRANHRQSVIAFAHTWELTLKHLPTVHRSRSVNTLTSSSSGISIKKHLP